MPQKSNSPHPVDIHVGSMIRQFRINAGVSQTELADSLGVSFQQIQKYENAYNRVSSSKLYAIANLLDHDLEDFFCGLNRQKRSPRTKSAKRVQPLSSNAIKVGYQWESIKDTDTRKWLSKLVASLSKEESA